MDETYQIPSGVLSPFPGVEVGRPVLFTDKEPVIDDCFVLDTDLTKVPIDTRGRDLRPTVSLYHPVTRAHLTVETTEPSFQFYNGDGINVEAIPEAGVPARLPRSGIAIEPNRYVDAVNRPEWRSLVLLKKGELYGSKTRFTAWLD